MLHRARIPALVESLPIGRHGAADRARVEKVTIYVLQCINLAMIMSGMSSRAAHSSEFQ